MEKTSAAAAGLSATDETCLRRAISLAETAVAQGRRPFGAVVALASGAIVAEAGAIQATNTRDWTAHSEMQALRAASALLSWDELADCTLYASGEPCPMCAAALYWCNLPRLVFGMSEASMRSMRAKHARAAGIPMGAREILDRAPRSIQVIGPALEELARTAHERFWPGAEAEA